MRTKLMSSAVVALGALLLTAGPLRDSVPTSSTPTLASAVALQPAPLFTVLNDAEMATVTGAGWAEYLVCGATGAIAQVGLGIPGIGVGIAAGCRFFWGILVQE
jgi:hypothetical protein